MTGEAQERAQRIRDGFDSLVQLRDDIPAAYHARDWEALGYDTWSDYCTGEFGAGRIQLAQDARAELANVFRDEGLSIRAIASATGASVGTVQGDIARCSELNTSPDTEPTPITGIDGKTYRPPEPKPRRKPITDQADITAWKIRRAAADVTTLLSDDRIGRNKEQVALSMRGHLLSTKQSVDDALAQLDGPPDDDYTLDDLIEFARWMTDRARKIEQEWKHRRRDWDEDRLALFRKEIDEYWQLMHGLTTNNP